MAAEDRFRRPAAHEQLLSDLTGKDGPFRALVDALMFAAALGRRKGKPAPFDKAGESIRLALMDGRQYGDVLIDMIAAAEAHDDPKILADERLAERIKIFEEYANAGLNFIQGELNTSGSRDLVTIVSSLVMDALTSPSEKEDDLAQLLQFADLDG
ncbi:DNA phosphorothioation-associated protein 4 [Streptomyces antimycoticus]|uniref:DNA phosphorothioation-associated protein 4 n=1 Tax=Streptomyces antimycoticus TaxID=68175 RepID=UPI0038689E39|nr:DNA phosphorothioation-associated protein 4 [Streptomyces antimycoticus]